MYTYIHRASHARTSSFVQCMLIGKNNDELQTADWCNVTHSLTDPYERGAVSYHQSPLLKAHVVG